MVVYQKTFISIFLNWMSWNFLILYKTVLGILFPAKRTNPVLFVKCAIYNVKKCTDPGVVMQGVCGSPWLPRGHEGPVFK